MDATMPTDGFYESLPILRDFTRVIDPALFAPLPDGWMVGVADVVQSTKAIAENRYKAVNMAGAAVIVAITNALGDRDFPFVFGGDGASFVVAAEAAAAARQALAATATWVKETSTSPCGSAWCRSPTSARTASTSASLAMRRRRTSRLPCSRAAASPGRTPR
jgi:hypothetical protein